MDLLTERNLCFFREHTECENAIVVGNRVLRRKQHPGFLARLALDNEVDLDDSQETRILCAGEDVNFSPFTCFGVYILT